MRAKGDFFDDEFSAAGLRPEVRHPDIEQSDGRRLVWWTNAPDPRVYTGPLDTISVSNTFRIYKRFAAIGIMAIPEIEAADSYGRPLPTHCAIYRDSRVEVIPLVEAQRRIHAGNPVLFNARGAQPAAPGEVEALVDRVVADADLGLGALAARIRQEDRAAARPMNLDPDSPDFPYAPGPTVRPTDPPEPEY